MSTAVADPHAVARDITRRHDENFPVAFMLLPRAQRADMQALYAFCRGVDDLGDELPPGTPPGADPQAVRLARLSALDAFEQDLLRCWSDGPRDPRLAALAVTVRRHRLAPDPFLRLVEANRIDQSVSRYDTYTELLAYCHHSATPVGELVLRILGAYDAARLALSDHTCIGLQLVNFWQDARRDVVERGRIYLPGEDLRRFGVSEDDITSLRGGEHVQRLLAFEVARARAELVAGAPLARLVPWRARLDIRMFTAGGLALCDAIASAGYRTLESRPAPGRRGRARIAADVILGLFRRRG